MAAVAVMMASACSSGDDDDAAADSDETTASTAAGETTPTTAVEIDRSGRFAAEDTFCTPATEETETEAPEQIDDGITEDEISITHIRVKLEELANLGFAVDIGDTNDYVKTFVDIVNDRCGGIHGRKIKLNTVEVPALPGEGQDTSSVAQAACIEAAEDQHAAFAFSTSGFGDVGVPCLTQSHEVVFITSYTVSLDDIDKAESRLYSVGLAGEESLTYAARDLAAQGLLDGKKIGVVRPDGTPDAQIVERGLVDVLEDELGLDVVRVDTIGCGGTNSCTEGVADSVQGMIADGVDVLFPALNVISLPGYLAEMTNQGVQPGDITFYQTGYLAQSGDLVSGKVVEFGGEAAGNLYNGTTVIASGPTGEFRLDGYEPAPFTQMCNKEYAENGANSEGEYDATNEATATKLGALVGVCSDIRMIARAIETAGANPSRASLAEAMENLGAVDQGGRDRYGSFAPGKYTAPNTLFTNIFHYPCPYETTAKSGACIVVDGDARPLPTEGS
ncbi:MAG TPA: ABC transporter substrate-binding protein [Acidimicrobiia bacterium]|nr:ABC transporter substrate-binding protein [Acidimicrobiia bacterium]